MTTPPIPLALVMAYLFILGACLGSFIGVVVARLPAGVSVVRPRSRCGGCGQTLRWFDNLPILSYMWLRGRCRFCSMAYGSRSLALEALTGLMFVALGSHLGLGSELVWWLVFASGLIAITYLDIDHFWVPDVITYPLMAWATAATALPHGPALQSALWGLLPALLLWSIAWAFLRITGREGLGFGDIKLLAAIGLMMGLPATLTILFLGSVQGALLGSIIVALGGHKERPWPTDLEGHEIESGLPIEVSHEDANEPPWQPDPTAVPFGPFLVLATFQVLFFGDVMLKLLGRWMQAR